MKFFATYFPKESDFAILNAIEKCLDRYTKMDAEGFSKEKATELLEKFREQQNYDHYFLYRQFIGKFRDWNPSSEEIKEFVKRYVQKYTPDQLSKLMRECLYLAEKGWEYGGIISFLRTLGERYPGVWR